MDSHGNISKDNGITSNSFHRQRSVGQDSIVSVGSTSLEELYVVLKANGDTNPDIWEYLI